MNLVLKTISPSRTALSPQQASEARKIQDNFNAIRPYLQAVGQYATDTATTDLSVAAAKVAGAQHCHLDLTGALAAGKAITLPTAAAIVAAIPNAIPGMTYRLRIANKSSGAFAWTVTTNTGLTLTGTMTIAQNTYREFLVTLTSLAAVVFQSLGQVTVAA